MNEKLANSDILAVSKGWDVNPARSLSLASSAYLDPMWLGVEREQIFQKSWQFLCHEEKLQEPGSYVTTCVQGQSIVATRGWDGTLRAFYNVCKHRGHELLQGEGKIRKIVCPYHAWTYELDGSFQEARQSRLMENFHPEDFSLSSVCLEVFCHLVFVNLDTKALSLASKTESLQDEIMGYAPDLDKLTFGHRLTYSIKANWKSVVDNFLECYHCPIVHKDFCTLVEMDTYKVKTHGIYSSHIAKAGRSGNKAYSVEGARVTDHAVWYLWPNTTLMRYPGRGNFMVWRFIPTGPQKTYEEFDFFFETAHPTKEEMEAISYIDTVLQQEDIGLVESVQRGMQTPAYNQGRYMIDQEGSGHSEHAVHHFHSLIIDAYRKACPTL